MAKSTASGVSLPAKPVAAPIDSAVATAGAMWVIDWKSTSGRPMALPSSCCDEVAPGLCATAVTDTSSCDRPPN